MEPSPKQTIAAKEAGPVWDTVQTNDEHLSHDLPCPRCGHAAHLFLACSDACSCVPQGMPGSYAESIRAA